MSRNIILDLAVSLDGYIEGPNGETDWCILDEDMDFYGFLETIDAIFYGRVSYEAWGNFYPDENAAEEEHKFWQAIHNKKKYVFTRQAGNDDRVHFIRSDVEREVAKLKSMEGKDIWLYGGAGLIQTFIRSGLIDRYRISVHPIVLGSGKPLFEEVKTPLELKLTGTNTFRSGVVQLIYEPLNGKVSGGE